MWDKDRKMQFGEESYEKANDDQTAVERKANGKQNMTEPFELRRRSIAHYTSFRSLVGSARLFIKK